MGIDRDLLATYVREKMAEEKLSLRKAAQYAGCSPATFSRLLGKSDDHVPDTATISAIATWLGKNVSDFESNKRPPTASLAQVSVHLHALPDLSSDDAKVIMNVVKLLYDQKRTRDQNKE